MYATRNLRIVVISPSDVQAERNALSSVVDYLNKSVAKDRGLSLEVSRWETDAYPRFHPKGPQGGIDEVLHIEDCDLLICIFWKRFGTQVNDARSGTEHEFRLAYVQWKKKGQPQIMVYFKQKRANPTAPEEMDQWKRVLEFKERFPDEGLSWNYRHKSEFENLLREHITQFIRKNFPLASEPHPSPATSTAQEQADAAGEPARIVDLFVGPARINSKHREQLQRALSCFFCVSLSEVEVISAEQVRGTMLKISLPAWAAGRLLKAYQIGEPALMHILSAVAVKDGRATETRPNDLTAGTPAETPPSVNTGDAPDVPSPPTDSRSLVPFGPFRIFAPFRFLPLSPTAISLSLLVLCALIVFFTLNARRQEMAGATPRTAPITPSILPPDFIAANFACLMTSQPFNPLPRLRCEN